MPHLPSERYWNNNPAKPAVGLILMTEEEDCEASGSHCHFTVQVTTQFQQVCKVDLESVVAKQKSAPYIRCLRGAGLLNGTLICRHLLAGGC